MNGTARNEQNTQITVCPMQSEGEWSLFFIFPRNYIFTLLCGITEQNLPLPRQEKLCKKTLKFYPLKAVISWNTIWNRLSCCYYSIPHNLLSQCSPSVQTLWYRPWEIWGEGNKYDSVNGYRNTGWVKKGGLKNETLPNYRNKWIKLQLRRTDDNKKNRRACKPKYVCSPAFYLKGFNYAIHDVDMDLF